MKNIIIFKTEGEALRMRAFLEAEEIPFVIKSFGDSVYSSVFQNQHGWGILEAPEESEEKILSFYSSEAPSVEDEEAQNAEIFPQDKTQKNTHRIYAGACIFLAAVSLLLGWLYYDLKKEYADYMSAGLTYSEWSKNGDVLVTRWKNNHHLSQKATDENFDYVFENIENYDTAGTLIFTSYDLNGNGFFDKTIVYSGKEEIREVYIDKNEDALEDEHQILLPDSYTLSLVDENLDHAYDKINLYDKENNKLRSYSPEEFKELLAGKKQTE